MSQRLLIVQMTLLLFVAVTRGNYSIAQLPELPANTWVNLKPSGIRPSLPGWETLHHCPLSGQAVVWGDYRTFSTEYQHSLLGYDLQSNS